MTNKVKTMAERMGVPVGTMVSKEAAAPHMMAEILELRALVESQQAKIDALMMEYCPHEMTTEQKEVWGQHQCRAPAYEIKEGSNVSFDISRLTFSVQSAPTGKLVYSVSPDGVLTLGEGVLPEEFARAVHDHWGMSESSLWSDKLLTIISYAYQIAATHNAPAHILDVLAEPKRATMEQVEAMLPYSPTASTASPVDMILHCPSCGLQHSDYEHPGPTPTKLPDVEWVHRGLSDGAKRITSIEQVGYVLATIREIMNCDTWKSRQHTTPVAVEIPEECKKCDGVPESCRFPLCRSETEQGAISGEVHASLYGATRHCTQPRCLASVTHCDGACHGVYPDGTPIDPNEVGPT